jgi:hypothetical protein
LASAKGKLDCPFFLKVTEMLLEKGFNAMLNYYDCDILAFLRRMWGSWIEGQGHCVGLPTCKAVVPLLQQILLCGMPKE